MRIYAGGAYADIVLSGELAKIPEASRPLTTELVYGVLRHQYRLDWIIDSFSTIKTKKIEHRVLSALRLGVYQLAFLSIPRHAVINETVGLVKSGGAGGAAGTAGAKKAGFVNAVLRKAAENLETIEYPGIEADPVRHISVYYSHPEWLVRRWIERYGVEFTLDLSKANIEIPPRTIRVNTLLTTVDALKAVLDGAGLEVTDGVCCPEALTVSGRVNAVDPRYYIQDEASQLVSHLVGPKPGESVLDACAAPGGKATHLAALMNNEGVVYALDKYPGRIKSVVEAAGRLGASIVRPIVADSAGALPIDSSIDGFDAVLLDAPCSGLGVVRRSPDIKLRRSEEDIARLSVQQARLLGNLAGHVRRGGRMVYSVCTFEPEETDRVVKGFLSENKGFVIEDALGYLPRGCEKMVDKEGFLRTYPHMHSLDGFFAARLKRS
jgi:16S rRNA (cytosine967-C5)-methyltransferase